MAGGSYKKRLKRSSFQPSSAMASPPSLSSSSTSPSPPPFPFNWKRSSLPFLFIILCVLALVYATSKRSFHDSSSEIYSFDVINEFPHDPAAFTQGLLYGGNDTLFESTGIYGRSSVRRVNIQTGQVQLLHEMDVSYFGEGLTLLDDRLFQVTWLQNTGFIYDRYNLSKLGKFTHQMRDGWGLATDGKVLFGSDGTSTLYQLDPQTLKVVRKATVRYKNRKVSNLNELEYVNGEVWANVWLTDCIARISHKDGIVLGWIILPKLREGLIKSGNTAIDVLNGIAWDGENSRLFVTGKLWPKLYEIKLRAVKGPFGGAIEELCLKRS